MAKVKPFNPGQGLTPRSKGDFITLATPNGYVAQKWPKKRGPPKTPYDLWRQKEFAWVANAVSSPFALDYGTAVEMVKGTTYVPRDFLMMCAYGNAYEIRNQDGTIWQRYRDVTNNPQYMLEQLTSTPGAIIYRGTDLWTWLPPASDGWILAMDGQRPVWKAPEPTVKSAPATTVLRRTTNQAAASAAIHTITWEDAPIDDLGIWDPTHPTRLTFPPNINRMRLSWEVLGDSPTTNDMPNILCRYPTTPLDFFGNPRSAQSVIGVVGWVWNTAVVGPWCPPIAYPYVELIVNWRTARPMSYKANTCLVLEMFLND